MYPVSPTRSEYPATPPSVQSQENYTPRTSSHRSNRLRDTWKSIRSYSKYRGSYGSPSPGTVHRKKAAWDTFASIRSSKPMELHAHQATEVTARSRTASPSKKDFKPCKISIDSITENGLTVLANQTWILIHPWNQDGEKVWVIFWVQLLIGGLPKTLLHLHIGCLKR